MELLIDRLKNPANWKLLANITDKGMIAGTNLIFTKTVQKLQTARVYRFDEAATKLAKSIATTIAPGDLAKLIPALMLKSDRMWIEFDAPHFFPSTDSHVSGFLLERHGDTGFLIQWIDEYMFESGPRVAPLIAQFRMERDVSVLKPVKMKNINDPDDPNSYDPDKFETIRNFYFGYSSNDPETKQEIMKLGQHSRLHWDWDALRLMGISRDKDPQQGLSKYLQSMSGICRHVAAFLLLMHFPPVQLRQQQRQNNSPTQGPLTLGDTFEDVSVRLTKTITLDRLSRDFFNFGESHIVKRQHIVDGHWRRQRLLRDDERPISLDQSDYKYVSLLAIPNWDKYKMVWIDDHFRGDPELGFVEKRKLVTL